MTETKRLVTTAICECGAVALTEDVTVGTLYHIDPDQWADADYKCGDCGKVTPKMLCVYAWRPGTVPGFMVAKLFGLPVVN